MALTLDQAYAVTHQAAKLDRAAYARTLTNNPSPAVVAALETEAAATSALLGAVIVPPTTALVINGAAITVQTSTGGAVAGVHTASVAASLLSNVKLAATVAPVVSAGTLPLQNSAGAAKGNVTATVAAGAVTNVRPPATVAIVANGDAITVPVTGTYVNKITCTVAGGVITAVVLG